MPLDPALDLCLSSNACGAGPFCDRPMSMMFNLANASPEVVRAMVDSNSGGGQESQEHISVLFHDVWAVGCLLIQLIAGHSFFEAEIPGLTVQQRTADVCQQHQ